MPDYLAMNPQLAQLMCGFPDRLHPVSQHLLEAYLSGKLLTHEFLRFFSLPNSDYIPLAQAGLSDTVAVLISGWKLSRSKPISRCSMTTPTRCAVSLINASGVTDPGRTPSSASKRSGRPKLSGPQPISRPSCFKSTQASSLSTTSQLVFFLLRKNKFLQCPPEI